MRFRDPVLVERREEIKTMLAIIHAQLRSLEAEMRRDHRQRMIERVDDAVNDIRELETMVHTYRSGPHE